MFFSGLKEWNKCIELTFYYVNNVGKKTIFIFFIKKIFLIALSVGDLKKKTDIYINITQASKNTIFPSINMKKALQICLYALLFVLIGQEFALALVPFPDQGPAWNTIGPWGHEHRYNWRSYKVNGQVVSKPGTSDYTALMYNAIPFRLMTPRGVVIDIEVDQDGKPTGPMEWIFNEPGKKYPLLFFMHGAGEAGDKSEMDNEHQLIHGAEKFRNAVLRGEFDGYVLFPHSANGFWANSTIQRRSVEIIQKMIADYHVDENRVIAAGLSSGGKGTWHAIEEWPKVFASAIAISGAPVKYSRPDLIRSYVEIPIWMSNGGKDDDPSPFTALKVAEAVKAEGGNLRQVYYPEAGHDTWNRTFDNQDFYPFLNRYSKTSIHVFHNETEFCPGEPFSVKLGLTAGFDEYQWRKDGTVIPNSNNHHLTVSEYGVYEARFRRGSQWTAWSSEQAKVNMRGEVTITPKDAAPAPAISVGLASTTLPALDGKTTVTLGAPEGYAAYKWSTGATTPSITVSTAGSYRVSVSKTNGCPSAFSNPVQVTVGNGPNAPAAPTDLTATVTSETQIRLNWKDNANNETAYEIYRSTTANSGFSLMRKTAANTNSFVDVELDAGVAYYYKVRAINPDGGSGVASASSTTDNDTQAPSSPANLTVTNASRTSISLAWSASADNVGVTSYNVYSAGQVVGSVTATRFTLENVTAERVYRFTVKAKDLAGNVSAASNEVSAETLSKGLYYTYYEQNDLSSVNNIAGLSPKKSGQVDNFTLGVRDRDDNFAFSYEGFISITASGEYTFYTSSDDGSQLFIDGQKVVDNDGLHGPQERSGRITLSAGSYPIAVTFFERMGGQLLEVRYQGPGISKQLIPTAVLKEDVDVSNPPVADAGEDQTLEDADNSGGEPVSLDGSGSSDSDGTIVSYVWTKNGSQLATGAKATVSLAVGSHTITLTVTDDKGKSGNDQLNVTVNGAVVNEAPQANAVTITGNAVVGKQLSGTYTYSDTEDDNEGSTTYQWYRAASASGLNEVPISGATQAQYTLLADDEGYYIRWGVTPQALSGNQLGAESFSAYSSVVTPPTTGGGGETALQTWKVSVGNGSATNLPPADWYTLNERPSSGDVTFSNLTNSTGNSTGVNLTVYHRNRGSFVHGVGTDGYVTGDDSGVYPDAAITNLYFSHSQIVLGLSGLGRNKTYQLTFFGSSSSPNSRPQKFIVNGQEAFLNTAQNQFNTAVLEGLVPNSSGELEIICTNDGVRTIVLNAFVIEEFSGTNARSTLAKEDRIGVDESKFFDKEVVAYPNPFSQGFTVLLPNRNSATELVIVDALGREVYKETTTAIEKVLDIHQALPGVYFLQVKSENEVQIVRLLKK